MKNMNRAMGEQPERENEGQKYRAPKLNEVNT